MMILGVNFGHNSSITLINDGQIVAAIEEEKVSSNSLLDYLRVIWVTPVMEKVMLQSHSEKR